MNEKPHVHQVEFDRQWGNYGNVPGSGHWVIRYGDTKVRVHRGPLFARRLQCGVERAIRRHDEGSIRAGVRAEQMATVKARALASAPMNSLVDRDVDEWPSRQR